MLKLEKVDQTLLCIDTIRESHIPELYELWKSQYQKMVDQYDYLPRTWLDDAALFSGFIEQHVSKDVGIVVTLDDTIIGFMTYDALDFHGELTAFIPILAHASCDTYKLVAYSKMYNTLSQVLVDQGYLNHIVTFFATDRQLQKYLYELGFGLYVVDAYRDRQPISLGMASPGITVRKAHGEDIDQLFALVKESDAYYSEAPLFLTREAEDKETLREMLADSTQAVFIAIKDNALLGFMNARYNGENDPITLSNPVTAMIDPLGAYIKKDFRGAGIGKRLLHEVVSWCNREDIPTIHVDFESANDRANQFWPRHFAPILYSVKRHLNNDVIAS